MRVLLINQFFWPDTAATSQLLTDVVRSIDLTKHEVSVLCGASDYGAVDASDAPKVSIFRHGGKGFSQNPFRRLASYASFFIGAVANGCFSKRPSLIVTLTTPPLTSVIGTLLKLLRGSRHFIWEMDMYPDVAVDLGMIRPRSLVDRMVGAVADWSRRKADGVIVLGEDMKARVVTRGLDESKVAVAENWADGKQIQMQPFPDQDPLTVLYSGNFGLAHEHETITAAIRQLRSDARFRFVFAGGGARRKALQSVSVAEGLTHVHFLPYASRAELSESLGACHIGLVTQIPATCGSVVPSKPYGLMAAGRPILYIGPPHATPARLIRRHNCGWRIQPGDVPGLIQLLEQLEQDRSIVRAAGNRARLAFEAHYDRPIGVGRILSILNLAAAQDRAVASLQAPASAS